MNHMAGQIYKTILSLLFCFQIMNGFLIYIHLQLKFHQSVNKVYNVSKNSPKIQTRIININEWKLCQLSVIYQSSGR